MSHLNVGTAPARCAVPARSRDGGPMRLGHRRSDAVHTFTSRKGFPVTSIVIERKQSEFTSSPVSSGAVRWVAAALFVIGAGLQVLEFLFENPPSDNSERVANWVSNPASAAARRGPTMTER